MLYIVKSVLILQIIHIVCAQDIISSQELKENRENYEIIDFRSTFERELDGFISGSILVPEDTNEEDFIEK